MLHLNRGIKVDRGLKRWIKEKIAMRETDRQTDRQTERKREKEEEIVRNKSERRRIKGKE